MLIFLSDLHLMDGTAGVHHLPASAFRGTLRDLAVHARNAGAAEIKIVFLGDIFDLSHSERWLDYGLDQRPWGAQPAASAAQAVFEGIVARNRETFEILGGSLSEQFGFPVEPERIYVPGNHDRLCNLHPALRARARECLGIASVAPDVPCEHSLLDVAHGVYARHGHEWDPFNFEGSAAFRYQDLVPVPHADYMQLPIGEVLASEVLSRLPRLVREHLPPQHPDGDLIYERFRTLFDVRPLVGMVPWIFYQAQRHDHTVKDAINGAVRQAAEEFQEIPFVRDWLEAHDSWRQPFDEADRVQLVFSLLETFRFSRFERALPVLERVSAWWVGDNYASRAAEDFRRLDRNPELQGQILYVLYGHTHTPDQRAIEVVDSGSQERDRVYLNTGTWRPTHRQAVNKQDFVTWKTLTYTIIYKPGERAASYPVFECWTGGLQDD